MTYIYIYNYIYIYIIIYIIYHIYIYIIYHIYIYILYIYHISYIYIYWNKVYHSMYVYFETKKQVVLRTSKQIINQPLFVNDIPKFWLVKAPRHVGWRTNSSILPFNISRVVFDRLKDAQRKTVVLSQVDNLHIYVRLCTASRSSGGPLKAHCSEICDMGMGQNWVPQ